MKLPVVLLLTALVLLMVSGLAEAQAVLGPCGQTEGAERSVAARAGEAAQGPQGVQAAGVPLPGERAIDFELTAVVGDEIKRIKLSDYQGMYRVLCFYPADFTFV